MLFEEFIEKLKHQLKQPLPGEEAQLRMVPPRRLTMKEYYQLRDKNPIHSAVLICLYPHRESIYTVMMLRPSRQGVHSDQVSFPGGKFEDADQSLEQTALREAHEEIGIISSEVELLGTLSPVYIPLSNYLVQPFVGYIPNHPEFVRNEVEVIQIIETDCKIFLDDRIKGEYIFRSGAGVDIEAPFYKIDTHKIWGATAMMISELEAILREIYFVA